MQTVFRVVERICFRVVEPYTDAANAACARVVFLSAQGKLAEAEPLYKEALAIDKKVYGDEHPEVATDLNNLAALLSDQVRYNCEPFPVFLSALASCC